MHPFQKTNLAVNDEIKEANSVSENDNDLKEEQHQSYFQNNSGMSSRGIEIELQTVQKNTNSEPVNTQADLLKRLESVFMAIKIEREEEEKNNGGSQPKQDVLEVNQLLLLGDYDHPDSVSNAGDINYVIGGIFQNDPSSHPSRRLSNVEKEKIINRISLRKASSVKLFANDIELYYQKLFGFVDKHLNPEKKEEYKDLKLSVLNSIYGIPAKFPTVRYIPIDSDMYNVIEAEWVKFEKNNPGV